jgi:hypothetical protein
MIIALIAIAVFLGLLGGGKPNHDIQKWHDDGE